MWRAFFLAIGISMILLGAECMVVDKAVLAIPSKESPPPPAATGYETIFNSPPPEVQTSKPKEIDPPDWAGWSLLSAGCVVLLYSFSIPRRMNG